MMKGKKRLLRMKNNYRKKMREEESDDLLEAGDVGKGKGWPVAIS